jgi:hypothetical protein
MVGHNKYELINLTSKNEYSLLRNDMYECAFLNKIAPEEWNSVRRRLTFKLRFQLVI